MVGIFSDKSALPTKNLRKILCLHPKEKNSLPKTSLCCSVRIQEIHRSCLCKWQKFQKELLQDVCFSSVLTPEIAFFSFKVYKRFPVLGSCRAEGYMCKVFVSFGQKILKSVAGIKPTCVSIFSWTRGSIHISNVCIFTQSTLC